MADLRSVYWTRSRSDVLELRVEYSLLIRLPLGLLWVAGAALGLAQWADRSITMNLLVAGQTSLERRRDI